MNCCSSSVGVGVYVNEVAEGGVDEGKVGYCFVSFVRCVVVFNVTRRGE